MGRLAKGVLSFVAAASWWLIDRLWGDALFAAVRPTIPDWAANPTVTNLVNWAVSYGPPAFLVALGGYFFISGRRQIRRLVEHNLEDQQQPPVGAAATTGNVGSPPQAVDNSFPSGLHISKIWIQRPDLASDATLHINLAGFNGTGDDIVLKSLNGRISVSRETRTAVRAKLQPASFFSLRNTRIPAFEEFTFTLEQAVPPKLADELLTAEEKVEHSLDFADLDIVVQSLNDRTKIARLPLWDGVKLLRRGEQIIAHRTIILKGPREPEITDLRSDIARVFDAASSFYVTGQIQECIERIAASNHPVWLPLDARNARAEFLHRSRIARAMREEHGPSFGDSNTRGEVLEHLKEAELTMDRVLKNYRSE